MISVYRFCIRNFQLNWARAFKSFELVNLRETAPLTLKEREAAAAQHIHQMVRACRHVTSQRHTMLSEAKSGCGRSTQWSQWAEFAHGILVPRWNEISSQLQAKALELEYVRSSFGPQFAVSPLPDGPMVWPGVAMAPDSSQFRMKA